MKGLSKPEGGTITSSIGYARIEPPSRWTGTRPSGQLWPRFTADNVVICWMDGHAKTARINGLKGPGPDVQSLDRQWNGLGQ